MPKILVIENEALLRKEIVAWLALEGFTVLSAKDGLTGVDSAFRHEPDVILCDLLLPGMDGYAVLAEIRAHPATAHTPFIFLSPPAIQIKLQPTIAADADDYLTKPLRRPELLAAVQTHLVSKRIAQTQHASEIEQLQAALAQAQVQHQIKANLRGVFANPAHNLLTNILLANHFCDQTDDGDAQDNLTHTNHVAVSVRQLMHMLDDILLITQLDIGTLDIKPEPVHVGQFLQQIVEDCQTIQGENYQIRLATHTSTPILLDKRLLHQVAKHLLANALQRSVLGGSVYILVESHKAGCRLVVQDHGGGLLDAAKWAQCDHFATRTDSPGLGLAQIKQVVELQGGSFQLESRAERGSTVTVTIPTQSGMLVMPTGEPRHKRMAENWHKMAA